MKSPAISVQQGRSTCIEEVGVQSLADARAEFVDPPANRNLAARGAITGMLLGAGLWTVILALVGVIKL